MSPRLASLALEKRDLLERSALYRLRLRREAYALRNALGWRPVAVSATTAPVLRSLAWSVAISVLGMRRATRVLLLAGRVVLVAKLARAAIGYARKPVKPGYDLP